jgi:alpha,alpha-trehalose phosphorylase
VSRPTSLRRSVCNG